MSGALPAEVNVYGDTEPIPISALQHAVYCLRQAALIHLEKQWVENRYTSEGHVLHVASGQPGGRKVRGVRRVMAMPLSSRRFGIAGIADLVEFHIRGDIEVPYPIEIKRGKTKAHRADDVQLCAQVLCLEEMTGQAVPLGAFYYAQTKRRVEVSLDDNLRALTRATIAQLREVFTTLQTPPAVYRADRCRACSLYDICQPKALAHSAKKWRSETLDSMLTSRDSS